MQQPMQPEMSFFLMPQFSFSNESSMRTSKLKIDLDSTCKELKFLHVPILQTSTELANIWLQAFISETGEISLLPPLLNAGSARGEQAGFWLGAAATPNPAAGHFNF